MKKNFYIVVIAALSVLCCWLFYSYMRIKEQNIDSLLIAEAMAEPLIFSEGETEQGQEKQVTFYICGEVKAPDIYSLPKGSRIIDAIELAGGATENARFEMMESVAGIITDGQKIYVPNVSDDIDKINYMNNNNNQENKSYKPKDPDVVVNINTAGIEELCQIQGIGEATAMLICEYREENGAFASIEDIMNVPRIGEKTFDNIKKNITVD